MATDPTTLPSVADLQKTKQYMDNINEFVSSENNTLVDRDGKTRRTLAGVNDAFDSMQSGELTAQAVDAADRAEIAADAVLANQPTGVIVFTTYALLDAYTPADTDEQKASYKVTNDPDSSLNGYYHWVSGTAYEKDADLVLNTIDENNTSDAVSGQAVYNAVNEGNAFAENEIANGDFASGSTTPFNQQRWNTTAVVDGAFVGESSGLGSWSYIRQYPTYSVGDKIYFAFSAHSPTAGKKMVFQNQVNDFTIAKDIAANEWTRFSGIRAGVVNSYNAVYGILGATAGEIYKLKNIMFINLTEVFGAGNEPDILDLESMLRSFQNGYFNGTQKILSTKNILPLVKVNKSSRLNVTNTYPLTSGYYTKQRAREAVPPSLRQLGLKLTYQTSANQWEDDQFIGDNLGGWLNSNNWLSNRQSIDLNQPKKSYGVEGAASFFDIQSYVGDTFSGDFCLEAVFTPKQQNDPEITYILNDGHVGVNVRKRFTSQFEFALKDGDGNRFFLRKTTEVNKPVHIALFVIGNVAEMYADGVFVDSVTLSNGLFGTPYSLLRFFEATSLFRVSATSTQNALERFNNGRPNSYIATDVVLEYKEDGITPTYFRENVSGEYYDYTDGDAVAIDAMYPVEVTGTGAPNFIPQFARQRYFDTSSNVEYVARGNGQLSDWYSISTSAETNLKQNTLVSGSNIKTINNVSVLGGGNLTVGDGGVSVEYNVFEDVTAYGAVGDGITNDTQAIKDAQAASKVSGVPVLFPGNDREYLITEGLIMTNGMQLIGVNGAALKRPVPVTQPITADVAVGDTTVDVVDGSAFTIGTEMAILVAALGGTTQGITHAIINDIVGNTIYFTAREGYNGAQGNHTVAGGAMVSTAFSMVTTNRTIDTVDNLVKGLSFITQSQPDDVDYYFLSIIHFNSQSANTTIENCKIDGSGSDGISLQGRERIIFRNNELINITSNAMHFGTTGTEIIIDDNKVVGAGRNAIFHCFNNDRITITNNHFTDCVWGLAEIDSQDGLGDRYSIIAHNTFENCFLGIGINGGYGITINANIFTKMAASAIGINVSASLRGGISIQGNTFAEFDNSFIGDGIVFSDAGDSTISGNIFTDFTGTGSAINIDDNRGGCESLIISNNNISGDSSKGVTLTNSTDCMLVNNIIKVGSGGTHIVKNGSNNGLIETPNILK